MTEKMLTIHYENMPMQVTEIFKLVKNENFQQKVFNIFLIFAQNIDCGYTACRGGSNEYPQSMFWSKNKRNEYTPANPIFYIKVGFSGYSCHRHVFLLKLGGKNTKEANIK